MDKRMLPIASALGVALGVLLIAPAAAAPAIGAGAASVEKAASGSTAGSTAAEQVRWRRRCWRNRWGRLECRRVWIGPGFGFRPRGRGRPPVRGPRGRSRGY
jgi:hypothetical protein